MRFGNCNFSPESELVTQGQPAPRAWSCSTAINLGRGRRKETTQLEPVSGSTEAERSQRRAQFSDLKFGYAVGQLRSFNRQNSGVKPEHLEKDAASSDWNTTVDGRSEHGVRGNERAFPETKPQGPTCGPAFELSCWNDQQDRVLLKVESTDVNVCTEPEMCSEELENASLAAASRQALFSGKEFSPEENPDHRKSAHDANSKTSTQFNRKGNSDDLARNQPGELVFEGDSSAHAPPKSGACET